MELESKGLLNAHIYNHVKINSPSQPNNEETRSNTVCKCDDCDEEFSSEDDLTSHMKEEHDDGAWTCNDCHFQTNTSEQLRQHLKKKGHQPSESATRQTNEIRKCFTCRKEFEGYTAMMNHRYKNHPSNKICKNIPNCTGWVNGNRCWYVHPELSTSADKETQNTSSIVEQEKENECKRCGIKYNSRNKFMEHYIADHASHNVCKNWIKNTCERQKCWYRHSHLPSKQASSHVKSVPNPRDFPPFMPPPQPPAQVQADLQAAPQNPSKKQVDMQQMITQMAMSLNTMEIQFRESRKQMHILQQILAESHI